MGSLDSSLPGLAGLVADHPVLDSRDRRAATLAAIQQRPGVTVGRLRQVLHLSASIVLYHVGALELAGHIIIRRVQGVSYLFPANLGVDSDPMALALRDPRATHLWAWLSIHGPTKRNELIRQASTWGAPRSTTRDHMQLLLAAGLLIESITSNGHPVLEATRCPLHLPSSLSAAREAKGRRREHPAF
jgi:hypothetical protein